MYKQQDYKYPSSCSNKENVPNNLSFDEIEYIFFYFSLITNDHIFFAYFVFCIFLKLALDSGHFSLK